MKNKRSGCRPAAVVLLSGGLDSAVTLYYAMRKGFSCTCLSFDYGQRHRREMQSAARIARYARCKHYVIQVRFPWKGSSLLDASARLPERRAGARTGAAAIPNTYVPGRNIIFLSFAVSCAEAINARAVFIGANAVDYSGYPDCRPAFYKAFRNAVSRGTRCGVEQHPVKIATPLIDMTKAGIVELGTRLKVPFGLTWSCYRGGQAPCGKCDSCFYRRKGFQEAGMIDPLERGRKAFR
ncbi:MAG TPA: 7-cyano-7-deazaguanine synthase QueC [Candidatus Omnitrophota bacterium]|nr:7-cyano-7-deazaguanine synthase QueC [Candidatus Omnitrophota bacterium]